MFNKGLKSGKDFEHPVIFVHSSFVKFFQKAARNLYSFSTNGNVDFITSYLGVALELITTKNVGDILTIFVSCTC